MSFIDDIIDFGSTAVNWFTGNSAGASLARTAVTGLALNQITQSINRENASNERATTTTVDQGVRLQVDPDPLRSIPVVYGRAVVSGIVTDAHLATGNQTMFYVLTLCERTGTKLSDSAASVISFKDVYWNNTRLQFKSDGITVDKSVDLTGVVDTEIDGKIKVYCYNAGSTGAVVPTAYTNGSLNPAYTIMPNWNSSYTMDDLVFVIIRLDYDSTKGVNALGEWRFVLDNSMKKAGDCLYDYMTNTRYGAGIDSGEIYSV